MRPTTRLNAYKVNANTVALRYLHAYSEVFITREKNRIRYSVITRQFYDVGNDQGVDSLLLACLVDDTKS